MSATLNPLSCNAVASCEECVVCDLQLGHGGNMHSGGDPRLWWNRDGSMVDFRKSLSVARSSHKTGSETE